MAAAPPSSSGQCGHVQAKPAVLQLYCGCTAAVLRLYCGEATPAPHVQAKQAVCGARTWHCNQPIALPLALGSSCSWSDPTPSCIQPPETPTHHHHLADSHNLAPDALKRAVKLAKVRFHPDKAKGSLVAKVYAEEVSKLLNSWDLG